MLKIRYRQEEQAHPLQAVCPWINYITPGIVLNKDGSLLASFSYVGVDPDNVYVEKANSVTELMERAYNQFDNCITAWWIVDKRRDSTYPESTFENTTAEELDRKYSKGFKDGKHYNIRYNFFLLYTGASGADKFFDRVSRLQAEDNASLAASLLGALKESLSGRTAFARDINSLKDNIEAFERIITSFTNSAPLQFKRLEQDDFTSSLSAILNRASVPSECKKPVNAMLDSWLPTNYVAGGKEVIQFKGNDKTVLAGVLGVVRWPEKTSPMLFETLAKMDMELTICQIIRFLGPQQSSSEINAAIEYYNLTQFGMVSHAIAKASGGTPDSQPGKAELLEQCKDALVRIGAESLNYVYHNVSVFVYAESSKLLNRNISFASQRLTNNGFVVIRERTNTMPSFAAMLPGQWSMQTRYDLLTVENAADTTPLYTMSEGSKTHPFFSEMIYKRPVSALASFANQYGGRYNFVPHVGQVGHMLIVAPTGGGKTTFVNFCLSQFQRYGNVNTFIFDRNHSCKIVTELHGGTHIDISSNSARFNPFFAMMDGSNDGRTWVREFILRRLEEGGFTSTADDRTDIDRALGLLANSGQKMRMSTLAAMLPRRLESELGEWLEGRPYGMFDSEVDDFSIANWTAIEMKEIMSVERLSRAFMDYAFRKIYVSLDGRPTFIYIEEASFLINNPIFSAMLDDWLKTFRKKNAFIWMTIQSPESVTSSSIAATLLDNVYSFLMCINEKVESHRDAYKTKFALQDHQVDMIKSLQPKRDYLLIQGTTSRVISTDFTPECLAYLRSEEPVLAIYDRHKKQSGPNWQDNYLAEIASL